MMTKCRIAGMTLLAALFLSPALVFSQASQAPDYTQSPTGISDQDIALLRQDIRSNKKKVIAANISLTVDEATKFWPIYDQYTAELVKINDVKYAAIRQYTQSYDTLTGAQAESLIKQVIQVDLSTSQLRQKYMPLFAKVITSKKTAMFFQLDRRLSLAIDMQIASALPLVQP